MVALRALLLAFLPAISWGNAFGVIQPPTISADQGYSDVISRFWSGTPTTGHVAVTHSQGSYQQTSGVYFQSAAAMWDRSQVMNLIYAYWKITGSADAANRIAAEWTFDKAINPNSTDFTNCGNSSTNNFASDDTSWNAGWMLQAYEVTGDSLALTYAQGALACAYTRWWDTTNNGYWYDDSLAVKQSYQAVLAWDNLRAYQLSGTTSYLTQAEATDTWMAANLQRNGQTVAGYTFPVDGMYYVQITAAGSVGTNPYQIAQTSSVVLLAGNMTMAALDAQLYAITGTTSYLTRAIACATGMQTYERDTSGNLLDDRDLFTNGWGEYIYAANVGPLVSGLSTAVAAATFRQSARSSRANARMPDTSYVGDWNGPLLPAGVWYLGNTTLDVPWVERVSVNSTMSQVASAAFP